MRLLSRGAIKTYRIPARVSTGSTFAVKAKQKYPLAGKGPKPRLTRQQIEDARKPIAEGQRRASLADLFKVA
jgi:hypothetical protein